MLLVDLLSPNCQKYYSTSKIYPFRFIKLWKRRHQFFFYNGNFKMFTFINFKIFFQIKRQKSSTSHDVCKWLNHIPYEILFIIEEIFVFYPCRIVEGFDRVHSCLWLSFSNRHKCLVELETRVSSSLHHSLTIPWLFLTSLNKQNT